MKKLLSILILAFLTSRSYGQIYVALDDRPASDSIKRALYTNYLSYGDDDIWMDLDARRNFIMDHLIISTDFKDHEQSFCPSVKSRKYDGWKRVNGQVPDFVLWLDFFEHYIDVITYDQRMEQWCKAESVKLSVLHRKYMGEELYFFSQRPNKYWVLMGISLLVTYDYKPSPEPIIRPCPIDFIPD